MFISGDFKSNDFVRAHSKALTDAFFVRAHPKGVTDVGDHQSIAPPESREALTTAALSLVCSFRVARLRILAGLAPARSFAALRMTTATVMLRRYLGSNEEGRRQALAATDKFG